MSIIKYMKMKKTNKTFISSKYHSMLVGGTLTAVLTSVMAMSDTLIAGIRIGQDAVAGVNLVLPCYSLVSFFALLFSLGVPILYSNRLGAFRKEEADRTLGTGILTTCIVGVVLFLVLAFGGNAYLRLFDAPETAEACAKEYLRWMKYAVLLLPVYTLMADMVFADGDETVSMVCNIVEGVGNVILSALLCRRMGTAGLGLGSFLSIVFAGLCLIPHFTWKRSSLKPNICFSFSVLKNVVRYGIVDASTYLFLAVFTAVMNRFVTAEFGRDALILVSVVVLIKESQTVFDGIGEAITPIIEVYLGEETYPGVREVWALAGRTAMIESLIVTLLFELGAPFITRCLGIEAAETAILSTRGIRLMALTLIFTCRIYLDSSYFILAEKISLGVLVCALRDVVCALPLAVLGGKAGGPYGMFAGLAMAPAAAYLISYLYVIARYGKENYALFLAGKDRQHVWRYEFEVKPEAVARLRDEVGELLVENGCRKSAAVRTMLLLEELFMLIYEHNPGRTVLAECSVELGDTVRIIAKDDGEILDLTDADRKVDSLRTYVISNLIGNVTTRRIHFVTLSYNRSAFEVDVSPRHQE